MIKAIIFDLSEVYLKGLLGTGKYLEKKLGIKEDKIQLKFQGKELTSLFEGKISEDEYWKKINKKNNWNINIQEFKGAVRKNFKEIYGTREIVEKLKERGFKLGLLSDHSKEWVNHCNKKFDYHKLFNSVLYSFEVEVCKPNKKMYNLMLKKLNVSPNECIFIDDNMNNIIPAKKLGINTLQFKNPEQLKKELIKLGVKI